MINGITLEGGFQVRLSPTQYLENKKGGREGVLCHRIRIIVSQPDARKREGVGGETKD